MHQTILSDGPTEDWIPVIWLRNGDDMYLRKPSNDFLVPPDFHDDWGVRETRLQCLIEESSRIRATSVSTFESSGTTATVALAMGRCVVSIDGDVTASEATGTSRKETLTHVHTHERVHDDDDIAKPLWRMEEEPVPLVSASGSLVEL